MNRKVCLITGGSSGIGKETALEIAKNDIDVVFVSRDYLRGKEALEYLKRESGNSNISFIRADLSSQHEVHRAAGEFRKKFNRLDILINNAGAVLRDRVITEDGLEYQLAVNHLAPFLLTNLLMDIIIDSAPSRIINVSSQTHYGAVLDFDDLNSSSSYNASRVYATTKLMNILFTYKLARMLKGTGVTANCLHPGTAATKLLMDYQGKSGMTKFLSKLISNSPAKAARTTIYLALSTGLEGVTGRYYTDKHQKESSYNSYNQELADHLWEVSAELTGINKHV